MASLDHKPSADEQQGGWYQRFIKKHQKLARHVSTAMVLGGVAGMLAISIATGGMPALTPLVWSGVGACVGALMGGMQVKYTLSKFYIAEQAEARRASAVQLIAPALSGLATGKKAAWSFFRAARPPFGGKPPAAANNNEQPPREGAKPAPLRKRWLGGPRG